MRYNEMSKDELLLEKEKLTKEFEDIKAKGLSLNMARGVPSQEQLDISLPMLDVINSKSSLISESGVNCASYGTMEGIEEAKKLLADMMDVESSMVMVGGNSSLNMMYDAISAQMYKSTVEGEKPWAEIEGRKFLCPAPGYDRHFNITKYFGFEMIVIPMTNDGPNMDIVEELVKDPLVKGIWCVPKYSNPQGITYSDETVKRFANLKPAAKDFKIMWDNAYAIHELTDTPTTLLPLWDECKKSGNENLPLFFCSTSKITFPGSGIAGFAASDDNMKYFKEKYKYQSISYDKINMLRHVRYFKDINAMKDYMKKHSEVLSPRFDIVCDKLESELVPLDVIKYTRPKGGYFVSVDVVEGTAKDVVALCKEAGVVLTGAGATYPNSLDPKDSNIRIAPSFPSKEDLAKAIDVFCVCVKLAAVKKVLV